MSDTEKQLDKVEEQVKDAVNANAVPAEPTKLKNDAEDLGAPVVKPTDSNPDATKKLRKYQIRSTKTLTMVLYQTTKNLHLLKKKKLNLKKKFLKWLAA